MEDEVHRKEETVTLTFVIFKLSTYLNIFNTLYIKIRLDIFFPRTYFKVLRPLVTVVNLI